jgi:nucleotide-binding universal stress UspA family protein
VADRRRRGERGKLARRIIGGVVDLVVERATCNVLIVRPREPG